MKTFPLLFALFLLLFWNICAVQAQRELPPPDSVVVKRYIDVSVKQQNADSLEEAMHSILEAEKLFGKNADTLSLWYAKVLLQKGKVLYDQNEFYPSLEVLQQGVRIYLATGSKRHHNLSALYVAIFNNYKLLDLTCKGLPFLHLALEVQLAIRQNERHIAIASIYSNMGVAYGTCGSADSAFLYHNKGLQIRKILLQMEQQQPAPRQGKLDTLNNFIASSLNNIGTLYLQRNKLDAAIAYFDSALYIRKHLSKRNLKNEMSIVDHLGVCYYILGRLDTALILHREVIKYWEKQDAKTERDYSNASINFANDFEGKGLLDSALLYHTRALTIRQAIYKRIENTFIADCYHDIGLCYSALGQSKTALIYCQRALHIWQEMQHPDFSALSVANLQIGDIYTRQKQYVLGKHHYHEALQCQQRLSEPDTVKIVTIYLSIGSLYDKLESLDSALLYGQQALALRLKHYKPNTLAVAHINNFIAHVLRKQGQADEALRMHQTVQSIQLPILSDRHPWVAQTYNALAEDYRALGDADQATTSYQKALTAGGYVASSGEPSGVISFDEVKYAFERLGNLYYEKYQADRQSHWLTASLDAFERYDRLVDYQIGQTFQPEALSEIIARSRPAFESGLLTASSLYALTGRADYLQTCFNYFERTQGHLLRLAVRRSDASFSTKVDPEILAKERTYLQIINRLAYKRDSLLQAGLDIRAPALNEISAQMFQQQEGYRQLLEAEKRDNLPYFELLHDNEPISLKTLRQNIRRKDQAVIQYFTGEKNLFILFATRDTAYVVRKALNFNVSAAIEQLHYGIHGEPDTKRKVDGLKEKTAAIYVYEATRLHHLLLDSITASLPTYLLIVPDAALSRVPFDALLEQVPTKETKYSDYAYVGINHALSYCYSAGLYQDMQTKQHRSQPTISCLSFAPDFGNQVLSTASVSKSNDSLSLTPLPYSRKEVASIDHLFHGKAYYDADATEERFRQECGTAAIIHLSTHGLWVRSIQQPCIAFHVLADSLENELLYLREIYNLDLNADLVVLSACETGVGPVEDGEGMISLARAFSYAGAKRILPTLWKVNDVRTMELLLKFYTNFHEKPAPVEALWNAKRDFIKNSQGEAAHPYYWAGFIGIGF